MDGARETLPIVVTVLVWVIDGFWNKTPKSTIVGPRFWRLRPEKSSLAHLVNYIGCLPTYDMLYKRNLTSNPLSSLCGVTGDTWPHVVYECT